MELSATERRVLRHLLDEALVFITQGDVERAGSSLAEATALAPHDADVLYARGLLALESDSTQGARELLLRAVASDPRHPDAHYLLARGYEEAGDRSSMIRHDLETLRLDEAADIKEGLGHTADVAVIESHAQAVLDRLPNDLRERVEGVPVVLEPRPAQGLVEDGFDPRAFGLFEGADDRGKSAVGEFLGGGGELRPTRIVLYYANLLAEFPDDRALLEQVEITLLHEIGHFFGLDEAQVAALGLE